MNTPTTMPTSPEFPTPDSSFESEAGPSRKRPRTDSTTSDDRKEARAHRNRLAAQNSRDKRKAHFVWLEQRVGELEAENKALRAGIVAPPPVKVETSSETARARENEELRERIKTLEKGWDAVVKALAAQGLPTGVPNAVVPTPITATPTPVVAPAPAPTIISAVPAATPSFFTSPTPISYPSPAPSNNSSIFAEEFDFESTRHLARVACVEATPPSTSLQRTAPGNYDAPATIDDAAMQELFKEILASPTPQTVALPAQDPLVDDTSDISCLFQIPETTSGSQVAHDETNTLSTEDWERQADVEMQRILGMLPNDGGLSELFSQGDGFAFNEENGMTGMEFPDLSWDMENGFSSSITTTGAVGVF